VTTHDLAPPPSLRIAAAAHDLVLDGRLDLAWRAVELALAVDPDQANAHTLCADLQERRGDFAGALPHWQRPVDLYPDSPGHRFNLALALLRRGAWQEGFALAEARLEKPDWSSLAALGSFAGLRHRVPALGADLSGKRVLAFTEQGLGDNIWAARWLPALAARVGNLDIAARPALRPLLAKQVPGQFLAPPDDTPAAKLNLAALAGQYDAFVPLMSLPHVLGDMTVEPAWLRPDKLRVAHWRQIYAAAFPGLTRFVGVVWRANPESGSAAERDLPPALFDSLTGVGVVNLQGGAVDGRAALPGAFDPLAGGQPPLDEFAAMIAATDLLLTADTMAAHLAGAMGHDGIVAVPSVPNFYWGIGVGVSPWYPSLRLARQAAGADWADAMALMVRAALA
jgi:hypothetical protein